ncbi:MAG: hypothetical protein ABI147_04815 [Acidobacteriaceae bacterium]
MVVPDIWTGAKEMKALPVADARLQLDTQQMGQTEDGGALALGVGVDCVGTYLGFALRQEVEDVVTDWFGEKEGGWLWSRFTIHHTPKHGSWLNQAEIEIGLFSRQCLGKRRISSIAELIQQAHAWNQCTNHAKTTIDWKFTRKKARLKLKYKLIRS